MMRRGLSLKPLEKSLGLLEFREEFFILHECPRVDAAPAASKLDRMFQMQHLVIHDVLESTTWHGRVVEDATHYDRVVTGIVMPETTA